MNSVFSVFKLGEVAEIIAGGDKPKTFSEEKSDLNRIPVFANAEKINGLQGYTDTPRIVKFAVTVAARGSNVGFVAIRKEPFFPIVRLLSLIPDRERLNVDYLFYYLKQNRQNGTGSGQPQITIPDISNRSISLPPLLTQQKIAKVLSDLDAKIELNNRVNAELEAMAKTLYDYWFVQFDFPDKDREPYKSSGGKMIWNEELKREIPEEWEVKNLFSEMDVQYGFPFDTNKFTDDTTQKPVIRIRDILENSISTYSTEDVDEKYRLNSGDLLIGMDGNFHLNFWDKNGSYLNQRSVRIRSKQNSEVSNFQALFQLTPYIKAREQNVSRTTVGHLSDKDLKRLFVINATKTNTFDPKKNFDTMLSKIISNRLQNQELASLRDWLLPMLMNGQVTVGDVEEKLRTIAEKADGYEN